MPLVPFYLLTQCMRLICDCTTLHIMVLWHYITSLPSFAYPIYTFHKAHNFPAFEFFCPVSTDLEMRAYNKGVGVHILMNVLVCNSRPNKYRNLLYCLADFCNIIYAELLSLVIIMPPTSVVRMEGHYKMMASFCSSDVGLSRAST